VTNIRTTCAADAPRFQLPGLEFTGLASPSRGSAGLCTWRLVLEPGLTSPEPHVLDQDEVFMVTSGIIQLAPDADVVAAGDVAVVPAGTPIQVSNVGEGEAEVVVAITAGFTATGGDGEVIGTPPWAV
jgi:mannose-6-phosphate isomerase-like protein (cupin superfamily)